MSLKIKMFILLICVVLLSILPVSLYFVKTATSLAPISGDSDIDISLCVSLDRAVGEKEKETAALALKKYRQISVLQTGIFRQVVIFSVVYSLMVIGFSLVVGYLFISRITRPLSNLIKATGYLASDNLDYKLREKAGGEIGHLVESFNVMAEKLFFARQQKIMAERQATWQHVARMVAHEIKNPLTPIKLSTERMYDKFINGSPDFPGVIKSTTSTILSEIENLQKLVNTFHRYARFPDPILRPENINSLIEETAAIYKDDMFTVECSLDKNLPDLNIDKGQIRESLINLIKNAVEAIKESERPGKIRITTGYFEKKATITIEDNGCGISVENQKKLYQPYFTTKKQGSGIGLALSERIINLHGGKIYCESEVGKGTKFVLEFNT